MLDPEEATVNVKPGVFQTWKSALTFIGMIVGVWLGVALVIWSWLP